jgi:hypothetical protein
MKKGAPKNGTPQNQWRYTGRYTGRYAERSTGRSKGGRTGSLNNQKEPGQKETDQK